MKEKIIIGLTAFICTVSSCAQVPANYSDRLQSVINSFQGVSLIQGISASVFIKDVGIWQGTTGESHAGIPLD